MKRALCFILVAVLASSVIPFSSYADADVPEVSKNTVEIVFDSAEDASKIVTAGDGGNSVFGDVNCDGKCNSKDTAALKKYFSGYPTTATKESADLNKDGSVNSRDLVILKKWLTLDTAYIESLHIPTSSSGSAAYDVSENAALVEATSGGDLKAKIVTEEIDGGFDAADYKYAGIVYKAETESVAGAMYKDDSGAAKTSYDLYSDGEYHVKLFALGENEDWNGTVPAIAFDLITGAAANDKVYLDSFIMTNDISDLERAATERLQARCYPSLSVAGGIGGEENSDTFTLVFNNEDTLSDLYAPNHTNYSFNKYATCLELEVDSGKVDPNIYLDLSGYGLSADEYRYITYVYKTRSASAYERKGEIFFCAGNVAVPTGGCSSQFGVSQDGNLYAVTIDGAALRDSSNRAYWNGAIHGLRFDYYQDATPGESVFVKGIVLSKTKSAADEAEALMTGKTSVGNLDAKAAIDYMYKVYSRDNSGSAYIEEEDGEFVFKFTGGTLDRFTDQHLGTRLSKFMAKTVGTEPAVEVLDGYEKMYESYAATELSEGYVTYKVQVDNAFYVLFRKTVYNMQKVILDHDLGPDCDDAAAVCIVVKAHMKGEINCLAITSCMYTDMSAYAAAAVPDYLGCHDIPFSYNNERSATGMNVRCCGTPARNYWNSHGPWPTIYLNTPLLRQIFADNGGKRDIIFITTGPLTTLYCLFNSGADSVSPMTGRELFAANVKSYVVGGGDFKNPNNNEHNFAEDFEATDATVNTITEVPMTFVGANVAGNFLTGDNLPNCPNDWVLKPYYYLQTWEQYYTRQAWDLATVYYAIYGGAGMWQVKSGYTIKSWTNGATIISTPGPSSYIDPIVTDSYVKWVFNQTMEPYLN